MAGNKMAKVAELFDLKLDERFFIDGLLQYMFTKDGLMLECGNQLIKSAMLEELLLGKHTVIKVKRGNENGKKQNG